jgi:hypothetical protein
LSPWELISTHADLIGVFMLPFAMVVLGIVTRRTDVVIVALLGFFSLYIAWQRFYSHHLHSPCWKLALSSAWPNAR